MDNNKPTSVYEKLDLQGEKIEDISAKLEGISINDLYVLAKRTWDYGDYQTAQKYYNHISLLRPLDWEAPLYASLCNFRGYHNMFFWTKVPEQEEKIIVSTINYINDLSIDEEKKDFEMSRCLKIILYDMIHFKDHYFKYKNDYDNEDGSYIFTLEDFFINVYKQISDINLNSVIHFRKSLSEECLDLVDKTEKISSKLDSDIYKEFLNASSKSFKFDYDMIIERNKLELSKSNKELTIEEIKEIKTKGTMFFEYNDKVIAYRVSKKDLISSYIYLVASIIGIIASISLNQIYILYYILPITLGVLSLIKYVTQKDRVKCSSFLSSNREINRLSSNGGVVTERKASFIYIFSFISMCIVIFSGVFVFISCLNDLSNYNCWIVLLTLVCIFFSLIISLSNSEYHSTSNGRYYYRYKNNIYRF